MGGRTVIASTAVEDIAIVPAQTVAAIDWRPSGIPGVSYKELASGWAWRSGLLRLASGARLIRHAHAATAHHVWVIQGTCAVLGETLGVGSYAFVPGSTSHALEARGTGDCVVAYVSSTEVGQG